MSDYPQQSAAAFLDESKAPEFLNLLADGFYITDLDRRIVFWNRAAERITGWQAHEVVGHTCSENILVHVDKDGHALCGHEHCPLHRSIITGQSSAEPLLVYAQHRSGFRVPVEVTVSPVRNQSGSVIGGIEIFRDLTGSVQDQLRAKEIQELAVRCDLPQDPRLTIETRYQPRDIVGGDFFRIEQTDPDHYALFVADAKGHGVAAALYTMLLRSLWHEHRLELRSPAAFMAAINQQLQAVVHDTGYFGTAVLATFNALTGQLRLVRAGHPAPLLFRAHGSVETIGCANPALGLFPDAPYRESTLNLCVGDSVLLYTDGATELFDSHENELGTEGLLQLARRLCLDPATSFSLEVLEESLLRFTNDIHFPDDLTLLKLTFQERPS